MNTLARPDDNPPDPQAPPYFRRRAVLLEAVRDEAARRGLGQDWLAA